jgi:hypothetical protein
VAPVACGRLIAENLVLKQQLIVYLISSYNGTAPTDSGVSVLSR